VRDTLAGPPGAHDPTRIDDPELRDSAVSLAIRTVPGGAEPVVPFVLRSDYRSDHAGEVGLPGGRTEPGDPPEATALREAEEEVGLPSNAVGLVGRLDDAATPTGYRIAPFVGVAALTGDASADEGDAGPLTPLARDPTEAAALFLVPVVALAAGRAAGTATEAGGESGAAGAGAGGPAFDLPAVAVDGSAEPPVSVRGTTARILAAFLEVVGDDLACPGRVTARARPADRARRGGRRPAG